MSDNRAPHESPNDLWDNPMGTDGFEFVEYTGPDPQALTALFERMGFVAAARHRSKNVTLYQQGNVNFIVNAEPESFAQAFARLHGPSVCAIAFRVADAAKAYERALALGEAPRLGVDNKMNVALLIEGDVLRAVARRGDKPHALEQCGERPRVGAGIFDELEPVGSHRVVPKIAFLASRRHQEPPSAVIAG